MINLAGLTTEHFDFELRSQELQFEALWVQTVRTKASCARTLVRGIATC